LLRSPDRYQDQTAGNYKGRSASILEQLIS